MRALFDHATRGRDFYFMQGFASTGGFINNTTMCSIIIDNRYYTLKSPAVLHASQVTPLATSDSIVEYGFLNTSDKSYPDDNSVASSLCENDSTTTWVADTNVKDTAFPALPSGYTSKNIAKIRIKYSDNNPGSWPIGASFTATTNTYLNNNPALGLISGNNFAFSHYTLAKFTSLDGANTYTTPNNNWITVNNSITNTNGFINTINRNNSTWSIKDTLYSVETEPKLAAGSTTATNYGSGSTRINLQPDTIYDFNQSITLKPGVVYETNTKTNLQYSFSLSSLINLETAGSDFASTDIVFKNIDNTPATYTTSCTYDKSVITDKKIVCNILNIPLNNPVIVATSKLKGVKNIPIGTSVPILGRVAVIKPDASAMTYTYQRNTQTTNFQFINNLNFYTTTTASTGNSEKSQSFNFKMDFASALAANSNVEIINILPFNSDSEGSKVTASSLKLDSVALKIYPLDTTLPPIDDTTNSVQIQYTKTPTSSLKLDPSDITNKSGGTTTWCDALSGGSCPANLSEVTALRFKIPDMPKAGDEGSSRQVVLNMSNNANAQYGDIYKNKFQLLATTINPTTTNNLISNIVAISIADSTLPEIPVINTIDAKLATTNPITTDNTPEIKGTSESGTTLKVSTNNLTLCDNTTTPATGNIVYTNEGKNWSCIPSVLSDGNYQITALTKDNVNLASTSAPATFTVDTTAPTKPTIATPQVDQIVTTSSFVATGGFVAGGSDLDIVSVTIRDKVSTQTLCTNTTTVNTISLWTNCNLTNLTNGNYQIEAVATDNAGLTTISDPVNFVVNIPTDITIDELDSLNIKELD